VDLWLLLAVTVAPLLLYGGALGRLRLSTMGLLQYLLPSLHFALAIGGFGESFTAAHAVSFGCIWAGLALYSGDALRAARGIAGQLAVA
jgi:chloramphenicol-sensitive protein RarD